MEDKSCKTPRWRSLKAELNNLRPDSFWNQIKATKNAVVVDVRTPAEFATGHIKNAININFLADDFWDRIEELPRTNDIFVYCRSGRRSIRTCTLMRNGGFNNNKIFNLDGGYALWQEVM